MEIEAYSICCKACGRIHVLNPNFVDSIGLESQLAIPCIHANKNVKLVYVPKELSKWQGLEIDYLRLLVPAIFINTKDQG